MTLPLPRVLSTQKMDDPGVEIDLLWNEHCDEIESAASAIAAHLVAGDPHPSYTTAAEAAAAAPVQSVAGRTGAVTLSKSDVGLAAVDNTADTAKPVSTAQQTALDLKAPLSSPTFSGTVSGITAAMVGAPAGTGTCSGTNSGDETTTKIGSLINGATAHSAPVDADQIGLMDSAASNLLKKLSWANLKARLLEAVFGAGYLKVFHNTARPWILLPSGTLNAGSAGSATIDTLATPLIRSYNSAGWVYVPAVGSHPGGWLEFSSTTTTVITLVNAVTTGGAYTQTTSADITGPSFTLPANSLGPNGCLESLVTLQYVSSANIKAYKLFFGTTNMGPSINLTTTSHFKSVMHISNRGVSNRQVTGLCATASPLGTGSTGSTAELLSTVDTTVDKTVSINLNSASASEYLVLDHWRVCGSYGA
jgi:hypothetical protein